MTNGGTTPPAPAGAGAGPTSPVPAGAFAGALACLPGMGPATLHHLLSSASPAAAWEAVRRGEVVRPPTQHGNEAFGPARASWAAASARLPVADLWEDWVRRGIGVTWPGANDYPARLHDDPEPPGVLFWRGRLRVLDQICVAVVGTRRCSPDGRAIAYELGRDLAAAGVCIVSGLALGIDGAAHLGALDGAAPCGDGAAPCGDGAAPSGDESAPSGDGAAPVGAGGATRGGTVGVAASGVDVVYPHRHSALWARVAAEGAVISENPPGRPAQAWRFPSRNRVIAGLVDLVVVVESHASGGSLVTAEKAIDRGIEVRVVPGPVHSAAAAGSNQLLYDGPGPVRDATDVLDALGILEDRPRPSARRPRPPRSDRLRLPTGTAASRGQPRYAATTPSARAAQLELASDPPDPLLPADPGKDAGDLRGGIGPSSDQDAAVLEAVGWRPTSLSRVVERSGLPIGGVGRALEVLRETGLVTEEAGWWCRLAAPGPSRRPTKL